MLDESQRAVPWTVAGLLASAIALLAWASPPSVMSATELDALAGGSVLASTLADGDAPGGTLAALQAGFAGLDSPTATALKGKREWRRRLAQPPLARWVAAVGIATGPTDATDLERARVSGALAVALAVLALLWAASQLGEGPAPWVRGVAALAVLAAHPLGREAATGAGAGAAAIAATGFAAGAACHAVRTGRGWWRAGGAWGLALAVHPLALAWIAPLFVAVVIARRLGPGAREPERHGELRLPAVSPGLFLAPLIAVVTLTVVWPSLWSETSKGLGAWFTDFAWQMQPPAGVEGRAFDQPRGRASMAWTPLAQWASGMVLPSVLAFVVGVLACARRGRTAPWWPLLALVTLLVGAGVDGSLWGARLDASPMAATLTALVAAMGVEQAVARLRGRVRAVGPRARIGIPAAAMALLVGWGLGVGSPSWAGHVGAEARTPLPLGLLGAAAGASDGGTLLVAADGTGWVWGLEVLRGHAGLDLAWAGAVDRARWVLVVGAPTLRDRADNAARAGGAGRPLMESTGRYGLEMALWGPKP